VHAVGIRRAVEVVEWLGKKAKVENPSPLKSCLAMVSVMLVKWKGKVFKAGWYSKEGFILSRFSVMVRLVVGERYVGTQSQIYVYCGCNEMRACFCVGAIWCMCAVAVVGSAAKVRNTHTQSVDAGSKKRSFHVRCHWMCALCVAWLKWTRV
jgi:hypothetical protein